MPNRMWTCANELFHGGTVLVSPEHCSVRANQHKFRIARSMELWSRNLHVKGLTAHPGGPLSAEDSLRLPGVVISDFKIIVPYLEALKELMVLQAKNPKWRDLKVTAIQRVQGEENHIVIFNMVAGSNMASRCGWLDEKKLSVADTRQTEYFILVGGPACINPPRIEILTKMLRNLSRSSKTQPTT